MKQTNKPTYSWYILSRLRLFKKRVFYKTNWMSETVLSPTVILQMIHIESLWFKCNLQATKWLQQVIRDKRIIYYITIIFEPCWWWSTQKSLASNYLFYQEIFAFSETLSKGFALEIMTSSTRLLLNCADNVITLFLAGKIIVVESV